MKQTVKRLLVLLLVLAMSVSACPVEALAAETLSDGSDNKVETGDMEVEVSGTDTAGELIAETIQAAAEEQESAESGDCYVSDLSITGTTATVEFQTNTDADLVVAIYDESTSQMMASGTAEVTSSEISADVTIETDAMPTYFVAAAYLMDQESHQPLCDQKTTNLYTQEMQDFLSKTTDDFDADRVMNLDDSEDTNFGVYTEDTIVVDAEGTTANQLTDNGDGTYTITNADSTFTGLAVGDVFSYDDGSGDILIVKVKEISVDGTTVTVTEDEDLELEDVFEYLRVESVEGGGTATLDNSDLPEGVTYVSSDEEGLSTAALDYTFSGQVINASYEFSYEQEDTSTDVFKLGNIKGELSGDISARLNFTAGIDVKLYIAASVKEFSLKINSTYGLNLEMTGKFGVTMPFFSATFTPVPTVNISITPSFIFELEGSASAAFQLKSTLAWSYDSESGKGLQFSRTNAASIDSSAKLTAFLGFSLEPKVTLVCDKIAKASLSGTVGVEVTAELFDGEEFTAIVDDGELHDCDLCISGEISAKVSASGSLTFLGHWTFGVSVDLISEKLYDYYISLTYGDSGLTTCPHKAYKCTFSVLDENGDPVSDIAVTGTRWEDGNAFDKDGKALTADPVTDSEGSLTVYLKNGKYTLCAENDNFTAKKKLTVHGAGKSAQLTGVGDSSTGAAGVGGSIHNGSIVASGDCGENLTWTLDSNGVLDISGTGEMDDSTWMNRPDNAPWYDYAEQIISVVLEEGVTNIGACAFHGYDYENIKSVTIPHTVVTIEGGAFSFCSGLTEITIPDSVTAIYDAFVSCTGLTEVTIPGSVTTLNGTFENCSKLTKVTIEESDSAQSIGPYTFKGCSKLTDVIIPDSVTEIWGGTFQNCSSLTSIILPKNITAIYGYMFYGCSCLESVNIPEGVTVIGDYAFHDCYKLNDVTFPDGLTEIGEYAFDICLAFTGITLPDSVVSIGKYAFHACRNVEKIIVGSGLTSVGDYAFTSCDSLISYEVSEENPVYSSVDGVLFNKDQTVLLNYPCGKSDTSYSIPETVVSVGNGTEAAFWNADAAAGSKLEKVTIPSSVETISALAFAYCNSLKEVDIPDSVISIGESAFSCCGSLTSVNIPNGITAIENGTFDSCAMSSVVIPDSVTSIGNYAFAFMDELAVVYIPNSVLTIGAKAFKNCGELTTVYLGSGVTSIGGDAFGYAVFNSSSKLTDVYYAGTAEQRAAIQMDGSGLEDIVWIYSSWTGDTSGLTTVSIEEELSFEADSADSGSEAAEEPGWDETEESTDTSIEETIEEISEANSAAETGADPAEKQADEDALEGMLTDSDPVEVPVETESEEASTESDSAEVPAEGDLAEIFTDTGAANASAEAALSETSVVEVRISEAQQNLTSEAGIAVISEDNSGVKTALFSGLVAGEAYVMLVVKSVDEDTLLTADNLLYIAQSTADEDGKLKIEFIPREDTDGMLAYAFGKSSKDLKDAEIAVEELTYTGGKQIPLVTVQYGGVTLEEDVNYTLSGDLSATEVGEYSITVTGKIGYSGSQTVTYQVAKEKVAVEVNAQNYPESEHNYSNNMDETYTYTYPSAVKLEVTFSADTMTEDDYDYIYLYDGDDTELGKYTGSALAGQTIKVQGDTLKIRVTSDYSSTEYGFSIDKIIAYVEKGNDGELLDPTLTFENAAVAKTCGGAAFTNRLNCGSDGAVTWASSNTNVATVDENGEVTIIGEGETIITATAAATAIYKSGSASYTLTVTAGGTETPTPTQGAAGTATPTPTQGAASTVTPTPTATPILKLNVSGTLPLKTKQKLTKLTVTMAEGDSVVSWTSSNPKIVKVNGKADGTCTLTAGKKIGKAKITIRLASGLEKTITVKTQKSAVKTKKITGVPSKLTLKKGRKQKLSVTLSPISSTDKITYKSSNKKVATVNSKGVIKAKKKGKATITIKAGKKTKKIKVTVK